MANYLKTDWDFNSDKLVEVFDELPLWAAPFGLKLLEGIHYKKGIRALDIGFGAGFPLTEIAMRLGKDAKVYGIDPWERAIERTKKKIDFYGIKNVEIIRGVAENIPLDDDSIDLIVSNNGLNNVTDLSKALSECSRIMKSGGQFIQTMNLNNTMMEFYVVMKKVLMDFKLDNSLALMQKHIYKKRKPIKEYLEMIESSGFEVKSVAQDQFEYQFVDGTTMFNHYFIRLAFLDGWKEIVPTEKQKIVFERIEDSINAIAETEGSFKMSVPLAVIDCFKI